MLLQKNSIKSLFYFIKNYQMVDSISVSSYFKNKTPLIEGSEVDNDISYQWVTKNEDLKKIEEGIPLDDFENAFEKRNIEMEFKVYLTLKAQKKLKKRKISFNYRI